MRPLDFYELGNRLAGSAATEAECRNVIGRLYYGLHHEACCRYFRAHPVAQPLGRGSRHRQLIERYSALRSTNEAQLVQSLLRQLSNMRNLSDYQLAGRIRYQRRTRSAMELMSIAVSVAAQLLAALETFSPGAAADGCFCPTIR